MNIFFASDDKFAQHLCVAMTSILTSALPSESFNFYVLDGGISENNKNLIKNLHASIEFIRVDDNLFDDCPLTPECQHISKPTYYRYLIPKLKPDLERVLYLDCDIIVEGSLGELWQTDFDDNLVVAVEEFWTVAYEHCRNMGIARCFNAGVMLINNSLWLRENISDKLFEDTVLLQDKIRWVDQDVLNYSLNNRVKFTLPKYNLQHAVYPPDRLYSEQEISDARTQPVIIHYNGYVKPWEKGCTQALWRQYYKYLKLSPFCMRYLRHKIKTAVQNFLRFPLATLAHYYRKLSKANALIFGAGFIGRSILPFAQTKYNVIAFIDNHKLGEYGGFPIYNPAKIAEIDYDVIIIAMHEGFDDVVTQLVDMGVKRWKLVNAQFLPIDGE